MAAGYEVHNSAWVPVAAGVAQTVLMVITPASFGAIVKRFSVGFDGVTPTAKPGFVDIVRSTNAANSVPGTGNTNETPNIQQSYGRSIVTGFTAFGAATAEPTVLTVAKRFPLTPVGGLVLMDFPLGTETDIGVSSGIGLRVTMPDAVNVHCSLEFERI